jgi:hypothetical protein
MASSKLQSRLMGFSGWSVMTRFLCACLQFESKNPNNGDGYPAGRLHQWLTEEVGHPLLTQLLHSLVMLQRLALANGHGWRRRREHHGKEVRGVHSLGHEGLANSVFIYWPSPQSPASWRSTGGRQAGKSRILKAYRLTSSSPRPQLIIPRTPASGAFLFFSISPSPGQRLPPLLGQLLRDRPGNSA